MEVIGQTQDDAVGEAFDKAAKLLGLPYPGGPMIDRHAQLGNSSRFKFPETIMPGLAFSFSGIKTAFLYFLRDNRKEDSQFIETNLNDICASLQRHLVKMLTSRLRQASNQTGIKEVSIAGGVSANSLLRSELRGMAVVEGWNVYIPAFEYCMDNAAMIAMAAHYKFLKNDFTHLAVTPLARMPLV
jgi:N6-L-threonylcarbamoyladenine synthase